MESFKPEDSLFLFDITFFKNPQPMWFFDTDSLRFIEVNQAAIDHYGYSRTEFLSMSIRDIRPEEDLERLDSTLKHISGDTSKRMFRHVLKDGTINHVHIMSYAVPYNLYNARLVMVTDLTDSSLYLERFDLISKATHDAIWDWNLETNELWWNHTFLNLFEYDGASIEPSIDSWTSRIHPDDHERVMDSIHKAITEGEKNWSNEYRFLKGDGKYAYVLNRAYTIFKNGKAVRMLGSMMDVTSQVNLHRQRLDTELLLHEITGASPTALWLSNAEGNMVYVNQTWINWSNNNSSDDLITGWVKIIHEDDRERVKETYFNAHATKCSYSIDYRIYFADGSIRWLTSTANPQYNSHNEFIGLAGSCTDITRLKHMQHQKDNFISTVSHELKTPIASLKGYEQLLSLSNSITDKTGRNFLDRIRVQINRLHTLVQDLLDISRIESGKLTFKEETFEVNLLIAELITDLQLAYPSHKLILLDNQPCKIKADRNRIIQLVTNLIDNAVKYSPGGQEVLITLMCDTNYMTVSVQDFGKGISKELDAFIFERFYQVNNVYKAPGLGIGLYICKEIVTRLNGDIWFDSVRGKGSTFYFKLPRHL